MWRSCRTKGLNLAVLLAVMLLAAGTQAFSLELHNGGNREILLRNNRAELQILENRERRREFQQQQQQFRAQDRQAIGNPQPRLEVPRMQGTCRTQVFGGRLAGSC